MNSGSRVSDLSTPMERLTECQQQSIATCAFRWPLHGVPPASGGLLFRECFDHSLRVSWEALRFLSSKTGLIEPWTVVIDNIWGSQREVELQNIGVGAGACSIFSVIPDSLRCLIHNSLPVFRWSELPRSFHDVGDWTTSQRWFPCGKPRVKNSSGSRPAVRQLDSCWTGKKAIAHLSRSVGSMGLGSNQLVLLRAPRMK